MMATPSYVAGPGELAPDLWQLLAWGSWLLSLPVLAFSAGPYFSGAWRALRQRRISMEVPVALGLVITFIASTGATFDPGGIFGDEVYFDSLTMFVSFLLAARYLELLARRVAPSRSKTSPARPSCSRDAVRSPARRRRWNARWPACPRRPGAWLPTAARKP